MAVIFAGRGSTLCSVPFSIRTDAMTIWPSVPSAPFSFLRARSAAAPAISISRPSSYSATSSRVKRRSSDTSGTGARLGAVLVDGVGAVLVAELDDVVGAGAADVADGRGFGVDTGVPQAVSVSSAPAARSRRPIMAAKVCDRRHYAGQVKWKLMA